jgi:hypothetical protein
MKKMCFAVMAGAMVLSVGLTACKSSQKPKEEPAVAQAQPLTYERTVSGTVTARVKAIDPATRVITLQDAGNEETFVVGQSVQRLNEVRPGDSVRMDYTATLLAELRPPTADEMQHPITLVSGTARAPTTASPAATTGTGVRIVTTVEAVDVPNMRVTLRGPLGDLAVVQGRNPENIKRIHVGDTIVITRINAVAMSLQKAGM